MKNIKKYQTTAVIFIGFICCFIGKIAFALEEYESKELIPGEAKGTTDLIEYLGMIYKFLLIIAPILAIVMIAIGAFLIMTLSAGNSSKIGDGKEIIKNAIIGLLIALFAWLGLYTINPDLVKGEIKGIKSYTKHIPKDP